MAGLRRYRGAMFGFTMIELIVVMAVLALLLSIAVPRYLDTLDRGKDQIVAHDLAQLRKAIDQYYGDKGVYPERLEDLVTQRYLRALPVNPQTGAVDWIVVPPQDLQKGGVFDVQAANNPTAGTGQFTGSASIADEAAGAPAEQASESQP